MHRVKSPRRGGHFWELGWAACLVVFGAPLVAAAQTSAVAVVRSTRAAVPANVISSVDDALLRDLSGIAHIDHPIVAPAAYDAIQLALGCEGETRSCLSSIAQTLQADALVIRRLSADETGILTLEVLYFETAVDHPLASARATVPAGASDKIVDAVPRLVRKLFGVAEPVTSPSDEAAFGSEAAVQPDAVAAPVSAPAETAADAPLDRPARHAHIGPLTWATLITGPVVFGVGAAVGLSAQGSWSDVKATPVETAADAQRIHRDFDSLQTRGTIATVLMPAGGVIAGLGVALLIMDLSRGGDASGSDVAVLAVSPVRGGGSVTFRGAFGGL